MLTPHHHGPHNPKALGRELLKAVRSESGDFGAVLQGISHLPHSLAAQLSGVAVELCSVRSRRGNSEEVYRSQMAGARLIVQCGLAFDTDVVNREIVPLLSRVPANSAGREPRDVWAVRLMRTLALGQLAPRIYDTEVDGVLRSMLAHSEIRGQHNPEFFLALGDFEESFRIGAFMQDGALRSRARDLCLGTIAELIERTVEGLADASPETFADALGGLLSGARFAAVSLLTVAPSIPAERSLDSTERVERIVDALEWLIKRPHGFPGGYFKSSERDNFESTRSLVSLAYGVLVANDPAVRARFEELKFPDSSGPLLLGSAFLRSMKHLGVEAAVEWGRGLAHAQVREAERHRDFESQSFIESVALSWHLRALQEPDLRRLLEHARNPAAQLLCAKALNDMDPWERG